MTVRLLHAACRTSIAPVFQGGVLPHGGSGLVYRAARRTHWGKDRGFKSAEVCPRLHHGSRHRVAASFVWPWILGANAVAVEHREVILTGTGCFGGGRTTGRLYGSSH